MAVAGESSIEYLHISGSRSLLPNINSLPSSTPDLWEQAAAKKSISVEIDDHVATMVEDALWRRPLCAFAIIEQDHPLHLPDIPHDVTSVGKYEDDAWFLIPPSLGGRSVPYNLRPIHNNSKGKQFGNLMISKYFEIMIQLWLEGMPPEGAFVQYQVSLEYNSRKYPERPDGFTYLIQFYKSREASPVTDIYSVIAEMARGVDVHSSQECPAAGLEGLYDLPPDWIFEYSEAGDKPPTEFIRAVGVVNQTKFEHLRVYSHKDFVSGKGANGQIPNCLLKLCNPRKAILTLRSDGSLAVDGDDISQICLMAMDSSVQKAMSWFDSWMYLRFMIEQWLKIMPAESNPYVSFQVSGETCSEQRFAAQFFAQSSSGDLPVGTLRCIMSKLVGEWRDYIERHSKPTESQKMQAQEDNQGAKWRKAVLSAGTEYHTVSETKQAFIDRTPILDLVPVAGGVMDVCRGIRDVKNRNISVGLVNIINGVGSIAVDVAGLGITSIVRQGAKPFVKSLSVRFAKMFARRVGSKITRAGALKIVSSLPMSNN